MIDWQEFPWDTAEPDPRRERLCRPNHPRRPNCRVEGANLTTKAAPTKDKLVLWAYNAERGLRLDDQLHALANPGMPEPDIVLLSEADRGCSRTGSRNVAREFARAFGMYYVYGPEFIELPRIWEPSRQIFPLQSIWRRCEHGNAILSRYPLGNVRLIRHRDSHDWSEPLQRFFHVGEPRFGGRMALAADVRIGDRFLRIYSVHLESGWAADPLRESEIRELIDDATSLERAVIIGGDMNCGHYISVLKGERESEPVTAALFAGGYVDAHAALPVAERITTDSSAVIDLLVGREVRFEVSGVGSHDVWGGLSDHLPVWSAARLV